MHCVFLDEIFPPRVVNSGRNSTVFFFPRVVIVSCVRLYGIYVGVIPRIGTGYAGKKMRKNKNCLRNHLFVCEIVK